MRRVIMRWRYHAPVDFEASLARANLKHLSVDEQLARVRDPAYWAALEAREDPFAVDEDGVYERQDRPLEDGLAWSLEVVPAELLAPARAAIARVTGAGWPAVFALLDDDLWRLLGSDALLAPLEAALGELTQLPGVYVHVVERRPGERGWEPHVDVAGAEASAEAGRLTVWLALTDAPLDGGCVYAVPRSATGALGDDWDTRTSVEMSELLSAAHAARAVPVRAGSFVAWRRDTLHWGAPVERAHPCPRVAISLEYARRAAPGERAFDPRRALDFEERLFLLGYSLCAYARAADREPLAAPFAALGERLMRS
jgi:hypothetical protein